MFFEKTEPSINFDVVRYFSLKGKWEIGIRRMIFGYRVSGNPIYEDFPRRNGERVLSTSYTFDYCAGADFAFLMELFTTMLSIFECLPDTVTRKEVQALLPDWEKRPINIEGEQCWPKLQELAVRLLKEQEERGITNESKRDSKECNSEDVRQDKRRETVRS